jgi:hypothetical protein
MRFGSFLLVGLLLAASGATAFEAKIMPYKIEMNGPPIVKNTTGKTMITVKFVVTKQGAAADLSGDYFVRILEEGKEREKVKLPKAKVSKDMSVVLAVDTSASMAKGDRMKQAKDAAHIFFKNLPDQADAGLILFDHKVRDQVLLTKQRTELLAKIDAARPEGGTAYFDPFHAGIKIGRAAFEQGPGGNDGWRGPQ